MKKLFSSLLAFVALAAAAAFALAPANTDAKAAAYAVYENKDYAFRAEHPAAWKVVEDFSGFAVIFRSPLESSDDKYSENVNVIVEDLADHPGITADGWSELGISKLQAAIKDFALKDRRDATLAGRPAKVLEYTGRQGEFHIHVLQTITLVNGKAYQVTFVGEEANYARYLPTAKRIIDSVVIK
jgi:hypothetical protein